MNLKNRKPVSEMSTQAIERELEKFAWEYIAWADYARSDAQYLEGENYLNERKASLFMELAERNTKPANTGLQSDKPVRAAQDDHSIPVDGPSVFGLPW